MTRTKTSRTLLVVDDEPNIVSSIRRLLRPSGLEIIAAGDGRSALAEVERREIDFMLLDVRLPDINGIEVLREVKRLSPETIVIIMSGHGTIKLAIEAIREGAFEFLEKPFTSHDLIAITLDRALAFKKVREENRELKAVVTGAAPFADLVGESEAMRKIIGLIPRLAEIDSTVLISGESGTGKEVLARAIHFGGPRRAGRFIPVDCGALPEGIIESELFGHVKGAFTGASESSDGLLRQAHLGTVFLDEIGELPLPLQSKLLRFLQEREVRPLGGGNAQLVDVRVIAASNRDLPRLAQEGQFRQDLFYRLNVVAIAMPALRERQDDIPLLIRRFLQKHGPRLNRNCAFAPETVERLCAYGWPGNIRELENTILQTLSLCPADLIRPTDLPAYLRPHFSSSGPPVAEDLPLTFAAYERVLITRTLAQCDGSINDAANLLGIGRSTLYRKIKLLGIAHDLQDA